MDGGQDINVYSENGNDRINDAQANSEDNMLHEAGGDESTPDPYAPEKHDQPISKCHNEQKEIDTGDNMLENTKLTSDELDQYSYANTDGKDTDKDITLDTDVKDKAYNGEDNTESIVISDNIASDMKYRAQNINNSEPNNKMVDQAVVINQNATHTLKNVSTEIHDAQLLGMADKTDEDENKTSATANANQTSVLSHNTTDQECVKTLPKDSGDKNNEAESNEHMIVEKTETPSTEKVAEDGESVRITINPHQKLEKRISKRNEIILVSVMIVLLAAVIAVVVWQAKKLDCKQQTATVEGNIQWPLISADAILKQNLYFQIKHDNNIKFEAQLGWNGNSYDTSPVICSGNKTGEHNICLEWAGLKRLKINFIKINSVNLDCYELEWQALGCVNQELTDCVNISSSHWYGGFQDKHQLWPFSRTNMNMSAYVANDTYIGDIGGVLERYFFSSNGTAVSIDNDVPLYFSINNPVGAMCFTAKYDKYPYHVDGKMLPFLKYKICQSEDVKTIHTRMSRMLFQKPIGIPAEDMFKYPVWSTWVQYQKYVSQSAVLSFANDILRHNFTHAQLEIDDDWTPKYGDMAFNKKFPNVMEMMRNLTDLGFKVTVWIHPFFNIESDGFHEASNEFRLIREYDSQLPALVSWWDGTAGILDVSNASACKWFLGKLEHLRNAYNITSFKFDAGEAGWLPHIYSSARAHVNPSDFYPGAWVQMAAEADHSYRQEVRVGYQTQKFPVFVRMIDKLSNWGHDNALKSVIPVAITFGLLGYPFVLPDMIGGNGQLPEPELFIRWLEMNTFLPSMQYSTVPWMYNSTVIRIAQKFTKMHENISDILIDLAKESVRTGHPIIRPLWWIAPDDEEALISESEFLVGNDILVAPVLERGARQRDIYLPAGSWFDNLRNTSVTGARWLVNYRVDIDELPYFSRL